VGYRNLTPSTSSPEPGSIFGTGGFAALHSPAPEGVSGVGLTLRHPKGISYALHYGSGSKADNLNLFESLERDLALDIDNTSFAQAYGGSFSWRTPVEGFTLKGAVSQMHLTGDALTRSTPQWSAAGIQSATRGRLFNTTRTWRAGAEQTIGDLKLSAEYVQSQMDTRFNDNVRVQQVGEGYTGKAAYRVNNWLQIGSSYSLYFADREDKSGEALAAIGKNPAGAWIQDIGVSARFDLNTRMALHLEGHLMNGLLGVVEGTEEDWRRFGARMTINW
jgi:predicted porin